MFFFVLVNGKLNFSRNGQNRISIPLFVLVLFIIKIDVFWLIYWIY